MAGGIESQIFSSIESATGENFEVDTGEDSALGTTNETDVQQDQLEGQLRSRESRAPKEDDELRDPFKKPETPKKAIATEESKVDPKKGEQKKPAGQPQRNERGDLVDEQGKVVARAGPERRLYTEVQALRSQSTSLRQQNDQLVRQLAETRVLDGIPAKYGMSQEDVVNSLEFAAVLKTNPTLAARKAIELALAKGANLREIVNDEFIPNVSLDATRRLLDERLRPVVERSRQETVEAQVQQEAIQKAQQFIADYPEADIHRDVVAHQMRQIQDDYHNRGLKIDPYIAAEMALNRVRQFAEANGFDFEQPLAPQVQARGGVNPPSQTPSGAKTNPVRQNPPKPMPNGTGGGEIVERKSRSANADDSYNSIVREAMRESGYNFN